MQLALTALASMPAVAAGDNLAKLIIEGLEATKISLLNGDVLVVGQKIVSKAEGRYVDLAEVTPGAKARAIADEIQKDPRLVELILSESRRVVRTRPGVIIVEHKLGFICANAGIDHSNVGRGPEVVLLLPPNPDASAALLREGLQTLSGRTLGVLINDSHGRAWRIGTVGVCIGLSGLPAILDERGWQDLFGRTLQSTIVGVADELAAAASLLMGQAAEGTPVVHVRGLPFSRPDGSMSELLRPAAEDLFR